MNDELDDDRPHGGFPAVEEPLAIDELDSFDRAEARESSAPRSEGALVHADETFATREQRLRVLASREAPPALRARQLAWFAAYDPETPVAEHAWSLFADRTSENKASRALPDELRGEVLSAFRRVVRDPRSSLLAVESAARVMLSEHAEEGAALLLAYPRAHSPRVRTLRAARYVFEAWERGGHRPGLYQQAIGEVLVRAFGVESEPLDECIAALLVPLRTWHDRRGEKSPVLARALVLLAEEPTSPSRRSTGVGLVRLFLGDREGARRAHARALELDPHETSHHPDGIWLAQALDETTRAHA
jgi:hypothetical protein